MRTLLHAVWVPMWVSLSACQGSLAGDAAPAAGPGAGGSAASGGAGNAGPGASCQSASEQGFTYLRRLTNAEYRATVQSLLGSASDPTSSFPPDSLARGFSNNSESIAISTLHAERYASAAEKLSAEVFADPARLTALLGCDLTAPDCLPAFIDRFGSLAFRRPLRDDERAAFAALAATAADDPDTSAGARLVVEAALQSSSFLFRVEEGVAQPDGRYKLSGPELATRLSFLLYGRAPDAALLAVAQSGALDEVEGLRQQAQQALGSGAAADALAVFSSEWLHLGQLRGAIRDMQVYPTFGAELLTAMQEETSRFTREILWGQGSDALRLFDADFTFVDAQLAQLYGLPAPATSGFSRVPLPPERRGLLTQASILTLTSSNAAATLIHRGKFLRDALLCDPPPPPPADVPVLEAMAGESATAQLERHASDPVCKACHQNLEPLGIGFQRFDAIGQYHVTDASGAAIPQSGLLNGFEPAAFADPTELASRLVNIPDVQACLVKQLYRYSFGRGETAADSCALESLTQNFARAQHSFPELVLSLVQSDAFRYRAAEPVEAP